ncbi:hypothetical protein [Paenibacillus polymyxa]|uniref:hypothetical protein n=1 Tax=Paenibacillus polymyxa TaxID=1406 RepID=UPI00287F6F77|nr:hypothetical protein [Paenibacillus polymyxa]
MIKMITDVNKAREILKSAKQDIVKMYGWTSKDYSARISETKKGLKFNIVLLKPKRGFKTIYDYLTDKIKIQYTYSDVTRRSVWEGVETMIEEQVESGVTGGLIFDMEWKTYPTLFGTEKTQRALGEYINNLYEYEV